MHPAGVVSRVAMMQDSVVGSLAATPGAVSMTTARTAGDAEMVAQLLRQCYDGCCEWRPSCDGGESAPANTTAGRLLGDATTVVRLLRRCCDGDTAAMAASRLSAAATSATAGATTVGCSAAATPAAAGTTTVFVRVCQDKNLASACCIKIWVLVIHRDLVVYLPSSGIKINIPL